MKVTRHEGDYVGRRHGFTQEIALDLVATVGTQVSELLGSLDPFCDHFHPHSMSQTDDAVRERGCGFAVREILHK